MDKKLHLTNDTFDIEVTSYFIRQSKYSAGYFSTFISVKMNVVHPLTKKNRAFFDYESYDPKGTYGQQRYRCWLKVCRLLHTLGASAKDIEEAQAFFEC